MNFLERKAHLPVGWDNAGLCAGLPTIIVVDLVAVVKRISL